MNLIEKILSADPRAIARDMTRIENGDQLAPCRTQARSAP
jgi:hypothetical protein